MSELPPGYQLQHGPPGWWVDGRCGYRVSGYHETEQAAVDAAVDAIDRARSLPRLRRQAWWVSETSVQVNR